jgi:hypothetical protein
LRIVKEGAGSYRGEGSQVPPVGGAIGWWGNSQELGEKRGQKVMWTVGMVCLPKNVMNAEKADLGTSDDPFRQSVALDRIYVARKRMGVVPVNHRQYQMEGT